MTGRVDDVFRQGNLAVGLHDDSGPNYSFYYFSVQELFAPGAVGEGNRVVFVGEQGERQSEVVSECLQG